LVYGIEIKTAFCRQSVFSSHLTEINKIIFEIWCDRSHQEHKKSAAEELQRF